MDVKFGNQVPKKSANKAVGTFSTTNASHVFVAMLSRIWIFGSGNSANQTVGKNKPITHQGPKTVGRISVFQFVAPFYFQASSIQLPDTIIISLSGGVYLLSSWLVDTQLPPAHDVASTSDHQFSTVV